MGERVHVRRGWWQQGPGQGDHASHTRHMQDMYNSGNGLQAQGGDGGHPRLAQEGWYPLIPIYPMDPKWILSLLLEPFRP